MDRLGINKAGVGAVADFAVELRQATEAAVESVSLQEAAETSAELATALETWGSESPR